ncbi:MAG TPA: OB-fold domain-containing protein [Acetobacteraceae bacterium]
MPQASASPLAEYIDHLKRGELGYQFSPSADRAVFYPRLVSPETGAADLEWRVSAGLGTVHATTVVHPQQGTPYNVALIDVDEGFRLMSRVEDIDPRTVKIGLRVKFRVHTPEGDEDPYPVFTPAERG